MYDYIGRLVKIFESGSKGSLAIGQAGFDCGCSYGTYQLTLRWGNVINFLKRYVPDLAKGLYYNGPDQATGNYPGKDYSSTPDEVEDAWMQMYNKVGAEKFFEYEHSYIKEICYDPCKEILCKQGIDVDVISRAYQEMIWSGAVHFGAITAADMFLEVVEEVGDNWGAKQEVVFNKFYEKRYEATGYERYKAGIYNGNSEVETLRPYLVIKPLGKENTAMKELCLVIDPGHYPGYNPGINPSVCEGDVMYYLAEAEKAYCDEYYKDKIDCFLTRDYKSDVGLYDRGMQAINKKLTGQYKNVMFMSDHTNAPGGAPPDPNVTGICVFTSQFRKNTYDFLDRFAAHIGSVMGSHYLYRDAKAWKDLEPQHNTTADYWGVIRGSMAGAATEAESSKGVDITCIIEHGFHTNQYECEWFGSMDNIKKMAQEKIDFIANEFGIEKKEKAKMTGFWLCDGTVDVTYEGADGLNVRTAPSLSSSVVYILKKGDKRRAVQGIKMSDETDWYRLEDGYYVSANKSYVSYKDNKSKVTVRKVTGVAASDVLNVRDFPNSYIGNVICALKNENLVDVIGECFNNNQKWYLVHIKNSQYEKTGWAAACYFS